MKGSELDTFQALETYYQAFWKLVTILIFKESDSDGI